MAQSLEEWIETHVKHYDKIDVKTVYNQLFFREEVRPTFYEPMKFYAPADGVIINQKVVKPQEKIVEIKGQNYTLEHILPGQRLENRNYYVIGIFMTLFDVHVNRMATSGFLHFEDVAPILSNNLSMIFMEKDIFKGNINYKESDYQYLFYNERVINRILNPELGLKYYMVQIADADVGSITHFTRSQHKYFLQGERFSFIRWGSQLDLIIPEDPKYKLRFLQNEMMHVKAGEDLLIEVSK